LAGLATGNFAEPFDSRANTFINCPAELGLFGYFFWMELIVLSIAGLSAIIRSFKNEK